MYSIRLLVFSSTLHYDYFNCCVLFMSLFIVFLYITRLFLSLFFRWFCDVAAKITVHAKVHICLFTLFDILIFYFYFYFRLSWVVLLFGALQFCRYPRASRTPQWLMCASSAPGSVWSAPACCRLAGVFLLANTGLPQPGVKRSSAGVRLLGLVPCVFE